jgi:hypothetical protein
MLPRSGLKRSDFVPWHVCDMLTADENVCSLVKTGSGRHGQLTEADVAWDPCANHRRRGTARR